MRNLVFALSLLFSCCMKAEQLKVLFINQGNITVSGKKIQVGNTFDSSKTIVWENGNQVIKVIGLQTHKVSVISAKIMKLGNSKNVADLLIQKQKLASRDGIILNMQDISNYFSRPFILLKCLTFETGLHFDEDHFFFIRYFHDGEIVNKRLAFNDNSFIIDHDIFYIDGVYYPKLDLRVGLYYYDRSTMETTLLTDQLVINTEPIKECMVLLDSYSENNLPDVVLQEILTDYCHIRYPHLEIVSSDILCFCKSKRKHNE